MDPSSAQYTVFFRLGSLPARTFRKRARRAPSIRGILVDPVRPCDVYAFSHQRGVWKSARVAAFAGPGLFRGRLDGLYGGW